MTSMTQARCGYSTIVPRDYCCRRSSVWCADQVMVGSALWAITGQFLRHGGGRS